MPDYNTALLPDAVAANLQAYGNLMANAKVSDAMVKANMDDTPQTPALYKRMGFASPDQYFALSAKDRIAATTGYIKGQGVQEMQARMADYNAQAQLRTNQAQDDQAFSNYAVTLDQQVNNPDPNNPDAVAFAAKIPEGVKFQIHAAAQTGRSNPRAAAAMIKPMMDYFGPNGTAGQDATPSAMTMPDGGVVYFQKGTKNPLVVSPFTKSGARVDEINAQADANADKNLLPPGTTFSTTANGTMIAEMPDGSAKVVGRAGTTKTGAKETPAEFARRIMGGGAAAPVQYKSAADVKAAYQAGKLDKAGATKILQSQFGMQ